MMSQTCRRSVESVMPYFTVSMGQAAITSPSLWKTLLRSYSHINQTYNLQDSHGVLSCQAGLKSILNTTFDREAQAFLDRHSENLDVLDDSLNGPAKARLLARAVAGVVAVFEHLSACRGEITQEVFDQQVQHFAESDQCRRIIAKIEESKVFSRCYAKSQLADVICQAVEDGSDTASLGLGEDDQAAIEWASELPSRNMGLPWGFTILALN
ncbi:hypothetical protein HYQ46_004672 [Verticillium longisporum]|nr:hypothetical protein HYQ46_004672 [Verticillium longisporum]